MSQQIYHEDKTYEGMILASNLITKINDENKLEVNEFFMWLQPHYIPIIEPCEKCDINVCSDDDERSECKKCDNKEPEETPEWPNNICVSSNTFSEEKRNKIVEFYTNNLPCEVYPPIGNVYRPKKNSSSLKKYDKYFELYDKDYLFTNKFLQDEYATYKIGVNEIEGFDKNCLDLRNRKSMFRINKDFMDSIKYGFHRSKNNRNPAPYDGYHKIIVPDDAICFGMFTNKVIVGEKVLFKDMDENHTKIFIEKYKRAMKFVGDKYKNDGGLCKDACHYSPLSIRYTPQKIRSDPYYALMALYQDPRCFRFIGNNLKGNPMIALIAVKMRKLNYVYLSKKLQLSKEIIECVNKNHSPCNPDCVRVVTQLKKLKIKAEFIEY